MFKEGDSIKLIYTSDKYTKLKPGAKGKIHSIDSAGTIHIKWDNGSMLGMLPGEDKIVKI